LLSLCQTALLFAQSVSNSTTVCSVCVKQHYCLLSLCQTALLFAQSVSNSTTVCLVCVKQHYCLLSLCQTALLFAQSVSNSTTVCLVSHALLIKCIKFILKLLFLSKRFISWVCLGFGQINFPLVGMSYLRGKGRLS